MRKKKKKTEQEVAIVKDKLTHCCETNYNYTLLHIISLVVKIVITRYLFSREDRREDRPWCESACVRASYTLV